MGDLEEKVDSAPKKRRGRPKKLQTAAEVEAAINLKEFKKSEAKLKKEKEKTISARKLFKTLEVDIQEANNSLAEIGSILSADFAARIDQEKAEIAMLQQDSSKQKIKEEEKGLEKKNLGSKIKDQAKKGMAPIKSMTDKLIELATFLLIGITGNAVFEFMKSDTFKAAWRGFTKFIIKGTAWLLKTTAAFIGFFSIKNLFKLFKKGIKFLIDIPKKIFNFAKNLFKLPKRIRVTSKLIKRGLINDLLGILFGLIAYQALMGALFIQASSQTTGQLITASSDIPITGLEILSVLSNTQVIAAHFFGLCFSLWLLRSIYK